MHPISRQGTLLGVISISLAAGAACSRDRERAADAAAVREAARAAYRLAMDSVVRAEGGRSAVYDTPVVPRLEGAEVRALGDLAGLDRALPGLQVETLRDFVARQSASAAAWREDVRAARDVELVTDSAARARLDSVRRTSPEMRYTIVGLSAAGFNRARTQGLLYATYDCGFLCAGGSFVLVVRQPNGMWRVRGTFLATVS
jgi:hypothetical protein